MEKRNKTLVVIPARGGSKGIPYKNIKKLGGKPLIYYSIGVARLLFSDDDICVSTDDTKIISAVENYGLPVPFVRPDILATDTATTQDVLLHAVDFYRSKGKEYDRILLLQPTSPLRTEEDIKSAMSLYDDSIDMVVSVKESHAAVVLCEDNDEGFLESIFNKGTLRRQEIKKYYEYNGSIYLINVESLLTKGLSSFDKKRKYVMPTERSIDIDTLFDWFTVEYILHQKNEV
ncbi:acylneuraminate cytidylyltransferase family protein [Dysgonomonas macrotermitis]|uniref:N-acylneuraminate cytidylyltransferase n=1 Tax=Dysgonomonas macrotermitis TaxID=1346286 RepID=A0A1M5I3L3_9BACT|nr:acylneuraminate cytidylyltransferase family protein [Dysgonomonas macrotermitis]SHG22905.1 N-acylneuraminate cytidylyltransferase [Dysgonomonas macrotermitis]